MEQQMAGNGHQKRAVLQGRQQTRKPSCEHAAAFTRDGSTDLKGNPINRRGTGGWRTCFFIYGNEVADRLAYYGIVSSLVTYLVDVLHRGLGEASKSVNNWQGSVYMFSVLVAFVADALLGRFYSIAVFGAIYLGGLVLLTLSVAVDGLKPTTCIASSAGSECPNPSTAQLALFYGALYVVALGSGGTKTCVSAFGADQFDEEDEKESLQKKSFFNWWYMLLAVGVLLAVTAVVYVQDNVGWGWGFGIPTAALAVSLLVFFLGVPWYRHQPVAGSPFTQLAQVLVAAAAKWNVLPPSDEQELYEVSDGKVRTPGRRRMMHTTSCLFLDKAATVTSSDPEGLSSPWRLCTVTRVEELKLFIRIFPIWVANLMFQATMAQVFTLFTRQGSTMDTRLGSHFKIPPASFQVFSTLSILLTIPIYDRVFVPAARRITGNPRGITLLQRMGTGLFLAAMAMVCAAVTESQRLHYVRVHKLQDSPTAMLPLSIFRLLPQYMIIGVADAFTIVAALEFFYTEAPDHMRSVGSALNLTATGVGSFLSSALISLTNRITSHGDKSAWIGANINRSQIHNFYWLLAVLGFVNLAYFLVVAARYKYKLTDSSREQDESTLQLSTQHHAPPTSPGSNLQ